MGERKGAILSCTYEKVDKRKANDAPNPLRVCELPDQAGPQNDRQAPDADQMESSIGDLASTVPRPDDTEKSHGTRGQVEKQRREGVKPHPVEDDGGELDNDGRARA